MEQAEEEKFLTVSMPGRKGLHTLIDPQDIEDEELADSKNVNYDGGFIIPRKGYSQLFPKPTGETGTSLSIITARTSDSIQYLIAAYGGNFYLWDDTNKQTILINGTVSPSTTTKRYTYANWNKGVGNDFVYIGNGHDTTMKWQDSLTQTTSPLTATSTSIAVLDGTQFTAVGTIIVQATGGTPITASITSTATAILTLSVPFGAIAASGASVTYSLVTKSTVPICSILVTNQRRLFAIGGNGTENTINYSVQGNSEDFTTTTGITGAGTTAFYDSEGPITAVNSFPDYLMIEKANSLAKFSFQLNQDLNTHVEILQQIMSRKSVGPVSQFAVVKGQNGLVYLTESDGIYNIQEGTSASVSGTTSPALTINLLSQKINDRITSIYYHDNAECGYFDQSVYFALSTISGGANNLIAAYDFLFGDWFIFDNWNVQAFSDYNNELYFLDNRSGAVNLCFDGYQDGDSNYSPYFTTKRFDFGEPAKPKTVDKIFLQGYLDKGTTLSVDVIFNENTHPIGKQTFNINIDTLSGNGNKVLLTPYLGGMGDYPLGTVLLGDWSGKPLVSQTTASPAGGIGVFRCYLDVSAGKGFFNIQLKFYSKTLGSLFAVDKIGFNVISETSHDPSITISPI